MSVIVYTCPFVPGEWIAAHGLQPRRIIPHAAEAHAGIGCAAGLCPFARAFANHVIGDRQLRGAVFTTGCDQMRRMYDLVNGRTAVKMFLLNVPKVWRSAECVQLYIDELRRMGRWLCDLGGRALADETLAETMIDFDQHRQAVRGAGCRTQPSCSWHDGFIKLAPIGGPLLAGELALFDLIDRLGGRIMLDATETGELSMPAEFDPGRLREDPVRELARAYFESIAAVWKRPNTGLFEWTGRMCAERQVQGVICHRLVWCDLWHAEVYRLRQALGLPFLDLDVSDDGVCERTTGRIQAFMETLQ